MRFMTQPEIEMQNEQLQSGKPLQRYANPRGGQSMRYIIQTNIFTPIGTAESLRGTEKATSPIGSLNT